MLKPFINLIGIILAIFLLRGLDSFTFGSESIYAIFKAQ